MLNTAWMLVILFGIAGLFAIVMKKRIELIFAFSIFIIIFVLYGFSLAGFPVAGYQTVKIAGICALICCTAILIAKREYRHFLLTPGALVFAVIIVVAWLAHRNQVYVHQDEFSHWGLACNRLYVLEKLPSSVPNALMHPAYPPGTTLFYTFYTWLGGAFSEGITFSAANVLTVSCMMPLMQLADWKNWKRIVPLMLICVMIPISFYANAYQDVYVDALLGCVAAYAVITWFTSRKDRADEVIICSAIAVLPLIKESGTALALFSIVLMAWGSVKEKNGTLKTMLIFVACLLISVFSWNLFCKAHQIGADKAFRYQEIFKNINQVISGNIPWEQEYQFQNFFRYLTIPMMMGEGNILQLSYVVWLMVFAAIAFWMERRGGIECLQKRTAVKTIWRMMLITAVYAVALFHLYLYNFSPKEAAGLHSFDRYMATIMTFALAVVVAFVLYELHKRPLKMIPGVLAVLMGLVLVVDPLRLVQLTFAAPMNIAQARAYRAEMLPPDFLLSYIDQDDRIAWLANDENHGSWLPFIQTNYELAPIYMDAPYGALLDENVSVENISNLLWQGDWNYVYLYSLKEDTMEQFAELFADQEQITTSTLYAVVKDEQSVRLHRVY